MTPEAQRIAIAEACGWKSQDGKPRNKDGTEMWWCDDRGNSYGPCNWGSAFKHKFIPDYLTDLNAMHEAEKVLVGMNDAIPYRDYCDMLMATSLYDAICATAAQRAEAFLRCLGLWVD